MNTTNLKKYAPQARKAFISAVNKRANELGIYSNTQIADASVQGQIFLIEGRSFDSKIKRGRERLVESVKKQGFLPLIEQMAYTWFNRLCAIRYMELQGYLDHGLRVLSSPATSNGFEILEHAQDVADGLGLSRERVVELKLAGNKDEELFRDLLVGQCHKLHEAMPFLFEALDDETELLLPDNLTRTDSLIRNLVDDVPEEDWQQVEVIGWLYQFYISEKKDAVMGKVVKSEDIPAATQLFTPNWIVKYLVQNSVGRQWLMTYPDSSLKAEMEYYIEPAEQTDAVNAQLAEITPDSIDPETIKVLDPACGSGHILVEAYNVLKAIYEERGYRSRDIPKLILENNLFGLDIDDRAAQLAGFSLMMKAREDDRRIFSRDVKLNVLALQETKHIDLPALWKALNLSDEWNTGSSDNLFDNAQQDLSSYSADERFKLLQDVVRRFEEAKTFGSLIDVPAELFEPLSDLYATLLLFAETGDSMQRPAAKALLPLMQQALVLAQRYDAVTANPPYMGSKGMNADLKAFAKKQYPNSKSDLFAIFMEHAFSLLKANGFNAQVNMQTWMFLSSFEKLRELLLDTKTFVTMAHLGARAFGQIPGEVVQTTAWILNKTHVGGYQPVFFRLTAGNEEEKKRALLAQENRFDMTQQDDFAKIPSGPIAYWVSDKVISTFSCNKIKDLAISEGKNVTSDNDRFIRNLWEVSSKTLSSKWYPCSKGGLFRKWYGNTEHVMDWSPSARSFYRSHNSGRIIEEKYWYKPAITWTDVNALGTGFRLQPEGYVFESTGPASVFKDECSLYFSLAILNSSYSFYLFRVLNPTIHIKYKDVFSIPCPDLECSERMISISKTLIKIHKDDWDLSETSIDFTHSPLINKERKVRNSYDKYFSESEEIVNQAVCLEIENNRIILESFSLHDEMPSEVKIEQITLNRNPMYRSTNSSTKEEANQRYQSDNLSALISYSIGCMMGRYSLDREGLVYAHAGNEGFTGLVNEGAYRTFSADDDGIIPLTDQEWFADDATNRFREFVRVAWAGPEDNRELHLQENLDFVAESLCLHAIKPLSTRSGGESSLETIRRYLSTQFYKDHLRTYKKRPIYWLFSSGKLKAFECLVYLHRYNEGTLARMRTEYVSPLTGKYAVHAEQLEKQIEGADSTVESNRLKKELIALEKKLVELREFDAKLKHFADRRISLDLDDGVKVNYGKFGDLLAEVKAITGEAPEKV